MIRILIFVVLLYPLGLTAQSFLDSGDYSWGNIEYEGKPWVQNVSLPYSITQGLYNRHVVVWASHGRYFDSKRTQQWRWQRPNLFTTNEDLFTQTIVVPYLIPMLENAGAIVYTPRERDWQKNEAIADNDGCTKGSKWMEVNTKGKWKTTEYKGFAPKESPLLDNENPFEAGTARQCKTTKKTKKRNATIWQPMIPEEGRYAVYVSYQSLPKSINDAQYIVWHKGESTIFSVNQQIGGGTWVYLGSFDFDEGCNEYNRVELSNVSCNRKGVVTADGVRFGGGMGNISRGGSVSGLPRCLEGARYNAQWSGIPYSHYSTHEGTDDYADDINARSLALNYIGGGSCYIPNKDGLGVPFELSIAVHSDAGYSADGIIGSLAICTTDNNNGLLNSGISRQASKQLATAVLHNLNTDLSYKYGEWNMRGVNDKNYSETRLPEIPSIIIETLSHQNFNDMKWGLDPNFRFTLARSLYKSILRYICSMHSVSYAVTPLAPDNFCVRVSKDGKAMLSWTPTDDPTEPTAAATAYVLYMATGTAGFDNGTVVRGRSCSISLEPGILYSFKVAALNSGGKSFPTEVLCAQYSPNATHDVIIVNAFHRLASPTVVDTEDRKGFDIDDDPGVTYGQTAGISGRQLNFDPTAGGREGQDALGYGEDEMAGIFVGGNDFDYVRTHALAISKSGNFNINSCSSHAIQNGYIATRNYQLADIVVGLEKEMPSIPTYGCSLLVSGRYVTTDKGQQATLRYGDETYECVAYSGADYRGITMPYPFESIEGDMRQASLMRGLIKYLLK